MEEIKYEIQNEMNTGFDTDPSLSVYSNFPIIASKIKFLKI